MDIYEFADVIDKELRIIRYPNQKGRFSATFEYCEIKDGACLISTFGDGMTPTEAVRAYSGRVAGKRIVFNAYDSDNRQEYVVPQLDDIKH